MKKGLRILAVILSLAMMVSIVAACGAAKTTEEAASTAAAATVAAAESTAPAEPAAPVDLKVEVFDRANAPEGAGTADNNYWSKKIQEVFGTPNNINVTYVPVPRSEEVNKLNVLMASNTAPDVVFTYSKDLYQQYASQGGLTDLTDLINATTNLKSYMEKLVPFNVQYKGRYMAMNATRTLTDAHMSWIRTDWLEALGMAAPTTTDEWYNVMKAFKEKNPGKVKGVIPFGLGARVYVDNHHGAMQMLWSFVTATKEEQMTLPYLMLPGWKEGVKFLNKMYNEGLIDTEFALDQNNTKIKENTASGKIGFLSQDDTFIYNDEVYKALQTNVPGAKLDPIETFMNKDGKYLKINTAPYGLFIMVPKTATADAAAAAVKYLDWMYSEDGAKLMCWGEEGRHYSLVDGITTVSEEQANAGKTERFNAGDFNIAWNGPYNPNKDLVFKQIEASDAVWGKEVAKSINLSMKDGFVDLVNNSMFERPIAAAGKYQENLSTLYLNGLAKLIMAKPAEFDALYQSITDDYMNNGGKEVMEEKKAAYAELTTK